MKRWIALLLVIAAFCAMALGSGHKRPIDTSEPDVEALKPKPKPSSVSELAGEDEEPAGPSFEQTVLYDQLGIKLTATGITYGKEGPAVRLMLENSSTIYVRAVCDGLDVNGYRFSALTECLAGPNYTAYGKILVDPDCLAVCGIEEIAQLDLDIDLTNAKTGTALPGEASARIRTDAAAEKSYSADKTGRLVYYDNGVEITVKGRDGRPLHYADLVLCLSSTNDDPVRAELVGFSVNGVTLEAELSAVLHKGRTLLAIVHVPRSTLAERDLYEIERYMLRFELYDETTGDLLAATDALRVSYDDLRTLP